MINDNNLIKLACSKTRYPDRMEPHVEHDPGDPGLTYGPLLHQFEPGDASSTGI